MEKTAKKKASFIRQIQLSSSLVRRARLIRRRTTNQYCEKLKKLQEDDAVLIHQILIIHLKPRSKASEYERACINTSSSEYIPSIEFAYPPIGLNLQKFPPPLFYPDFMKSTVQRKEEMEAFTVVLTNEKGDRTFAYCFKFLWKCTDGKEDTTSKPNAKNGKYSVLVFASHYSHEALFHRHASNFVINVQKDSTKLHGMCKDLLNLRFTTSDQSYRYSKYVIKNTLETNELPSKWSRGAFSTITIQKFGVENTVFIFLSLLSEKRVIVTGANITEVSLSVQSFVRLLAPLEWPHTLIPIVPDSQTELCFNPTPYICGILRYNLNRVKDLLCPSPGIQEDVTVVDVERGLILPFLMPSTHNSLNNEQNMKILLKFASSMDFPKPVIIELVQSLQKLLPIKKPSKVDYKIEKCIMIFYAKLFGHFKRFGNDILTVRNRKQFVLAHPCSDTRLFLKWFVENGILQFFIFNRKSEKQTNEIDKRFQEILKQYSPPVDKKGKCKKAKSIMWKIFTR